MGRYSTSKVIRDNNNARKLSTTILPSSFSNTEQTLIRITSADRLDRLANIFYDDSTLWWIIASANQLGKGSLMVPPDTILVIPEITSVLNDIEQKNSER